MASKSRKYAEGTTVSISKTHDEIRALLAKYQAEGFMVGEHNGVAQLAFAMRGRQIRFRMPLPRPQDKDALYVGGKRRTDAQALAFVDGENRRRWRALLLSIKAKLESAHSGIETFEDAFLAQTVLPDGRTMGEYAAEQLPKALAGRRMPPLLGGPSDDD